MKNALESAGGFNLIGPEGGFNAGRN